MLAKNKKTMAREMSLDQKAEIPETCKSDCPAVIQWADYYQVPQKDKEGQTGHGTQDTELGDVLHFIFFYINFLFY